MQVTTLRRLLQATDAKEVRDRFASMFPRSPMDVDIASILEWLRTLPSSSCNDVPLRPTCEKPSEDRDTVSRYDPRVPPSSITCFVSTAGVCGRSSHQMQNVAVSFYDWRDWLDWPIVSDLSATDVVVWCLFEMGMYGPDDEFQKWRGQKTSKFRNLVLLRSSKL